MKKKLISNIHVEIDPYLGWIGVGETERIKEICRQIERDVKRHIDNVSQTGIYYDTAWVCEFCEYEWEWRDNEPPGCCHEAEQEWVKNNE